MPPGVMWWCKVLVSDELLEQYRSVDTTPIRDRLGRPITVDVGKPGYDGFYTPTFTVHEDDAP